MELLSMLGDIAEQDGEPALHAHVVLGTRDGFARGGHLRSGRARPTLELVLDEVAGPPPQAPRSRTGLALIDLTA